MMNIDIKHPTKAYIDGATPDIIKSIRSQLTYINTSVSFQIKKHKENRWWKRSNPITWEEHLQVLTKQLKGCALHLENGKYWVRPGSIPYLSETANIKNSISYPNPKPIPWSSAPKFEPYPYQSKSVEELISIKHGNISLPTGSGKSFALLMLARKMGLNAVIVTPSKSIFNELLSEFQKRLGKKYVGGYGDGKKDIKKKITIAIGKSLTMLKPETEAYNFFRNKQMMMVDESHTFAADQLEKVCYSVLEDVPYRFFVSATQTRNDGTEKKLQSIIGKTVLEMGLLEATEQGYLCPLNFNIIEVISPSTVQKRDPMECKRTHFLYNDNIAKMAARIANASWESKQESTLILVEELRQISMLEKYLKIPYGYVHSADKKKSSEWDLEKVKLQDEVDKFNNGEIKVLIGTRAISTGTNMYPTHNTINWVGGGSEILTKQGTMGRSTRKLEISDYAHLHKAKPFCRVYDFRVKGIPILEGQLQKRIKYYSESGGNIKFIQ